MLRESLPGPARSSAHLDGRHRAEDGRQSTAVWAVVDGPAQADLALSAGHLQGGFSDDEGGEANKNEDGSILSLLS